MTYYAEPITDTEVIGVACPMCGEPTGQPCRYMPLKMADQYSHRPGVQAKLARVGTPTPRPHNERRAALRLKRNRARWARERRHSQAPPASPELLAAHRAGVDFDRREYLHLAQWLALWGEELFASSTQQCADAT